MKRMDKKSATEICKVIGCSGINKNCPGNVNCDIIKKFEDTIKKEFVTPLINDIINGRSDIEPTGIMN